ncbi:MAG: 2-phospho-L-lactate guanylyltransferase [Methanolinea sp.]|nr:2-phospho-L-lactate guanylyltransferase [Methanolinea sp.]
MGVPAIIPFKPQNPKSRLSCVLTPGEREIFAQTMLSDVVGAVLGAGCDPKVVSTEPFPFLPAPVETIPLGLNETLNKELAGMEGPVLIIMADLPLADSQAIGRVIATPMDVALVPGRGGGTNAIYLQRGSSFRVDYYGASFLKHARIARERGLSCDVVDTFRLHTDVDEKEDLVELLIHGRGTSRKFLEDLGFELSLEKGRVGIRRKTESTDVESSSRKD